MALREVALREMPRKGRFPKGEQLQKWTLGPSAPPHLGAVWWGGDTGDTRPKLAGGRVGFLVLCSPRIKV